MADLNLSRPCDACGKPIGGGYWYCPKCNIHFCFYCGSKLLLNQKQIPPYCPMCGDKLV